MKIIIKTFLLIVVAIPVMAYASVYSWTDEQGTVHYSDTPVKDAKPVQLINTQSYSVSVEPAEQVSVPTAETSDSMHVYENIAISRPANETTFNYSSQGDVQVNITLQPALQFDDQIQLIMDGKVVISGRGSSFKINNVDRGAHVLQANIVDAQGQTLQSSATVTFYMQRPRVIKNK